MNNVEEETAQLDRKIGARLRYVRKARGLTQKDVGGVIGVTFQQVQKYELGVNRISTAALIEVARTLDISPLELLADEAEGHQTPDEGMLDTDGAEALLRAYRKIGSPKLRRIVRELARSLTEDDGR